MTAMDLELGVFTRRQVDDHMFVLKEIETRRSQIKFLDFCNVQVLGPLRQKIKELEENVQRAIREQCDFFDSPMIDVNWASDYKYKKDVLSSFEKHYEAAKKDLDLKSKRYKDWRNVDMKSGAIEEEIRDYRAIGIVIDKLGPDKVDIEEEVKTLNPELLKKGGDYSEKPEEQLSMMWNDKICVPGDPITTGIIKQLEKYLSVEEEKPGVSAKKPRGPPRKRSQKKDEEEQPGVSANKPLRGRPPKTPKTPKGSQNNASPKPKPRGRPPNGLYGKPQVWNASRGGWEDDASQDNGDLTSKKESSKPSPGKRGRAPKFSLNDLVEVNWKRGWYSARIIGNVGSYTVAYLSDTGAPAETERDVKRYRIRDPIGKCFIKPPSA